MSDTANRLLAEIQDSEGSPPFCDVYVSNSTAREAVCEIDRLEAENARLFTLVDDLVLKLKPFGWFGETLRDRFCMIRGPEDMEPDDLPNSEVISAGNEGLHTTLRLRHFDEAREVIARADAARGEGG